MRYTFKAFLIYPLILAILCFFSHISWAQEIKVPAVPPEKVEGEALEPLDPKGLVVVELFSSQACMFCPKADSYLETLSEKSNVIALACHVDYYDIKEGSLAQSFCTQRQSQYSRTLRSGPKFTPQMVFNGHIDAIGHKQEQVDEALHKAAIKGVENIKIEALQNGKYRMNMPEVNTGQYALWVASVEKPLQRKISQGKNRGQDITYKNILSSFESPMMWDGTPQTLDMTAGLSETQSALVVFAQNQMNGRIVAAGRFQK